MLQDIKIISKEKGIRIYWYHYEDDNDMAEAGKELLEGLDFELVSTNENITKRMNKELFN